VFFTTTNQTKYKIVFDFVWDLSGTRLVSELKNFILFDCVDTIIELLTIKEPVLIKI